MADDEPDDDDPLEAGVPVVDSRTRVWTSTEADGPPTAEERARFGIPEPAAIVAQLAAKAEPSLATRADPTVVVALIAKLPEFNPAWPENTQAAWFAAFERIAGMR